MTRMDHGSIVARVCHTAPSSVVRISPLRRCLMVEHEFREFDVETRNRLVDDLGTKRNQEIIGKNFDTDVE